MINCDPGLSRVIQSDHGWSRVTNLGNLNQSGKFKPIRAIETIQGNLNQSGQLRVIKGGQGFSKMIKGNK